MFGLTVPAGRGMTFPLTASTNSLRTSSATLMGVGAQVRVEGQLGEAVAVAQVDEDQPAMVAAAQDPAHQDDVLTDLFLAQFAAEMGAFPGAEGIAQGKDSFGKVDRQAVWPEQLGII